MGEILTFKAQTPEGEILVQGTKGELYKILDTQIDWYISVLEARQALEFPNAPIELMEFVQQYLKENEYFVNIFKLDTGYAIALTK